MSVNIPPQLQQYLKQLDDLQNSYSVLINQKQSIDSQLVEIKTALEELKKTPDKSEIFKLAGSVLIETKKAPVTKDLEESESLLSARKKTIEKQEKTLTDNIKTLSATVNQLIQKEQLGKV